MLEKNFSGGSNKWILIENVPEFKLSEEFNTSVKVDKYYHNEEYGDKDTGIYFISGSPILDDKGCCC